MIFGKNPRAIGRGDIEALFGEPEREDLEFKGLLPGSRPDDRKGWYSGRSEISDKAKESLAKELIAFANRSGGTLILGIDETLGKPACAEAIQPLPRPHEFADQIRRCFHDIIEPPLSFDVVGVPTEADGSGVVVFQTGSSASAPHRLKLKSAAKECYIRRNDESVPMDMRSIHDLVLERMRLASNTNEQFEIRARKFREFAELTETKHADGATVGASDRAGGFRVTAIALEHMSIADISTRNEFRIARVPIVANGQRVDSFGFQMNDFRPVLRGWRAADGNDFFQTERLISGLGVIEDRTIIFQTASPYPGQDWQRQIYDRWVLHTFVNVIYLVETFRGLIDRQSLEFGVEFELRMPTGWKFSAPQGPFGVHGFQRSTADLYMRSHRLSIAHRREFPMLLRQLEIDLWNLFDIPPPRETPIDFDTLLKH